MERNRSLSPFFLNIPEYSSRARGGLTQRTNIFSTCEADRTSRTFDFSALPLTIQHFDIDSTEEKFLETRQKILILNNTFTDCRKCFECRDLLSELEEISTIFSKNRIKLLNVFLEMYISLQEEIKKNKEVLLKYQKLQQEIDSNIEGLTDRKISNKLKSLKNEIKHKSQVITELNEKMTSLGKNQEFKSNIEISSAFSKELLEKDKIIYNLYEIIKEKSPGTDIPALNSCKECSKKQEIIDSLNLEISKQKETITNFSKLNSIPKDSKNIVVKSMLELKELIIAWWEKKQDCSSLLWKRDGEELIQELVHSVNRMAESKVEQTGRELRSAVHKKICEVEADFIDLGSQDEKIKGIIEKFLELPYLLKPLFDLLKEYEKKEYIS